MTMHDSASAPASHAGLDAFDARLIRQVAHADRRAFDILYRSYFHRLARFLQRRTRNVQLTEEIVNDTMLVVWNKARTWDGSCKVSTWVFAIAWRKAMARLRAADEPVGFEPDLCESDAATWPEHCLALQRRRRALARALDALPREQRTVVKLTYFHDMAYADIADVMGCAVNTVKTRMFHARRRLAVLLGDALEEEA